MKRSFVWRVASRNLLEENSAPLIMGILNITPDSFSDGGRFLRVEEAVQRAEEMINGGAVIIDVGGESSRPGAPSITAEEEQERILPVVRELVRRGIIVSVDTHRPETASAALKAGASIINDITAGRGIEGADRLGGEGGASPSSGEEEMFRVVREQNASIVLMHMRGTPSTMQKAPAYQDCVEEVLQFLKERVDASVLSGIPRERIAVDPGIGFGKRLEDNLALMRNLERFHEMGCAVLLGASRKSFIKELTGAEVQDRVGGSIAAALLGGMNGAEILRVHDTVETHQALLVARAILQSERITSAGG